MRVVFASAELAPIASVGGLAAAATGLGTELRRAGIEIDYLIPDYGTERLVGERREALDVPEWVGEASVRIGDHPVVGGLHLVSVPGMARPHPYLRDDGSGWPDNAERFLRFARAVAAHVERDPPDVLHLNDWHTATALAALDHPPPSVLSIHNLAYQGTTDDRWLELIGPHASHYEWWGGTNPLSGGIALADRVVTVSPTYAAEITTPEQGCGLDEPLRWRGSDLIGILNGIDTDVWDPSSDPHLVSNFTAASLERREANRSALLARVGLPDDRVPVATVVTRLTQQKGIDLLLPLVELLDQVPVRLAILGSGDAQLATQLADLAAAHPDWLAFVEGYDEGLSHLMFGGGDLYLMPSRFEPCGLTQMQAMRYGCVPVVTHVGGLVDTVPDADAGPSGMGFVAPRAQSADLVAALFRAARRLRDRRRREALQRRMMGHDWSWRAPASEYRAIYEGLELTAH